jgi:negative regulator of sigma E activity
VRGRARVWAAAGALALAAGAVAAAALSEARASRGEALLEEIASAERRVPYEGTLVLRWDASSVALRVRGRGGVRRVEPPAGRPFVLPPDGLPRLVKDAALAARRYEVARAGREVVAGREAERIELRPRRRGRPEWVFWADAERRFPLAFAVRSEGRALFEARFESIAFPPDVDVGEPPRPEWWRVSREPAEPGDLGRAARCAVWEPGRLPWGFELRGSEVVRLRVELPPRLAQAVRAFLPGVPDDLEAAVAHLRYTDGMAEISVFQCPAESTLGRLVRRLAPPGPTAGVPARAEPPRRVTARRFADRRGAAYLMELEGTLVLVAGNLSPDLDPGVEEMVRSFRPAR